MIVFMSILFGVHLCCAMNSGTDNKKKFLANFRAAFESSPKFRDNIFRVRTDNRQKFLADVHAAFEASPEFRDSVCMCVQAGFEASQWCCTSCCKVSRCCCKGCCYCAGACVLGTIVHSRLRSSPERQVMRDVEDSLYSPAEFRPLDLKYQMIGGDRLLYEIHTWDSKYTCYAEQLWERECFSHKEQRRPNCATFVSLWMAQAQKEKEECIKSLGFLASEEDKERECEARRLKLGEFALKVKQEKQS